MKKTYYAVMWSRCAIGWEWQVMKRVKGGGEDRVVAQRCGETYARRIAKLLNESEERLELNAPLHWKDDND